jgi:cell division protein FtsL
MKTKNQMVAVDAKEQVIVNEQPMKTLPRRQQGGFTTSDFIFWMIVAALAFTVVLGSYNTLMGMYRSNTTVTDVTQIKAAVEDWKGGRTDVTGVTITELCKVGNGNQGATWCGAAKNGVKANRHGGNYAVTAASNTSQIDVTITNVDAGSINSQANKLAPVSAGRCASIQGCTTVTATGNTIKVTM